MVATVPNCDSIIPDEWFLTLYCTRLVGFSYLNSTDVLYNAAGLSPSKTILLNLQLVKDSLHTYKCLVLLNKKDPSVGSWAPTVRVPSKGQLPKARYWILFRVWGKSKSPLKLEHP